MARKRVMQRAVKMMKRGRMRTKKGMRMMTMERKKSTISNVPSLIQQQSHQFIQPLISDHSHDHSQTPNKNQNEKWILLQIHRHGATFWGGSRPLTLRPPQQPLPVS